MPVLDAKALKTDRKGLAFLRSVLRSEHGSAAKAEPRASSQQSDKPQATASGTPSR